MRIKEGDWKFNFNLDTITPEDYMREVVTQTVGNIFQFILTRGRRGSFAQYFLTVDVKDKDIIRQKLEEKGFVVRG